LFIARSKADSALCAARALDLLGSDRVGFQVVDHLEHGVARGVERRVFLHDRHEDQRPGVFELQGLHADLGGEARFDERLVDKTEGSSASTLAASCGGTKSGCAPAAGGRRA
jgi:hypothetical protein